MFRVQVKLTNYRQVDIDSDEPEFSPLLRRLTIEQARRQFGDAEYVEIVHVERPNPVSSRRRKVRGAADA